MSKKGKLVSNECRRRGFEERRLKETRRTEQEKEIGVKSRDLIAKALRTPFPEVLV